MESAPDPSRIRVGTEVDYNAVGSYWAPARVEHASDNGSFIGVRFAVGGAEITHTIDMKDPKWQQKVATIGTLSERAFLIAPISEGQRELAR